jgi:hypothetical protein
MTEAPLFEVIPPAKRTYDELVELNHYLNKRCSMVEERLYELTLIIRDGDEDREDDPKASWKEAIEQLDQWDHEDGYEWSWKEHQR